MKSDSTLKLTYAALFAALCCVATMFIKIPVPMQYGYVHAGDAVVLLSALLLGPWWGALVAGLGSAMADVLSSYIIYAPGTFIIKAAVALCAAYLFRATAAKKPVPFAFVSGAAAELVMVAGYFLYEYYILGYGAGAIADIPGNLLQGASGAIAGGALFAALVRTPYVKRNLPRKDGEDNAQ